MDARAEVGTPSGEDLEFASDDRLWAVLEKETGSKLSLAGSTALYWLGKRRKDDFIESQLHGVTPESFPIIEQLDVLTALADVRGVPFLKAYLTAIASDEALSREHLSSACRALVCSEGPAAASFLLGLFDGSVDNDDQRPIRRAIVTLGAEAVPFLSERMIASKGGPDIDEGIELLLEIGDPRGATAIADGISRKALPSRYTIQSLLDLGEEGVMALLQLHGMCNGWGVVENVLAVALAKRKPFLWSLVDQVKPYVDSEDFSEEENDAQLHQPGLGAARVLAGMRDAETRKRILDRMLDRGAPLLLREDIAGNLQKFPADLALPALLSLVEDPTFDSPETLDLALNRRADPKTRPALEKLAKSKDEMVSGRAKKMLKHLWMKE